MLHIFYHNLKKGSLTWCVPGPLEHVARLPVTHLTPTTMNTHNQTHQSKHTNRPPTDSQIDLDSEIETGSLKSRRAPL